MRWANLALPLFVLSVTSAGIAALVLTPATKTEAIIAAPEATRPVTPVKPVKENTTRNVGGGVVPTPAIADAPLERIAPAPILKPLEAFGPPTPPLGKDEPFLLFQPLIENAGTLVAEGRTITLKDVLPIEASRMCNDGTGNEWPCGMKARTAFRALVRGRAISCFLPDQQKTAVETECLIGKENLGQWLVEQGWAKAAPGSDLESLGQAAKLMGRGIYGKGS